MKAPTYQEQFDKLTEAYIRDEIYECDSCACFVGNLLNNTCDWALLRYSGIATTDNIYHFYTIKELGRLEKCFMNNIPTDRRKDEPKWETELFDAFEKTLEILKEVHESKGEVINDKPIFSKRKLVNHAVYI